MEVFRTKMFSDLIKSIESKKDVYVFSCGDDENIDECVIHEKDDCIEYYVELDRNEIVHLQEDLFSVFIKKGVDMDNLHITLDIVQYEKGEFYVYNRLFIFWTDEVTFNDIDYKYIN